MKYISHVFFYVYVLILVLLTGLLVFWLNQPPAWFIVTMLLILLTRPDTLE